jgi:Family of unknown function (DUF5706)
MSDVDSAWKTLERVNEWIRFADSKAVALLTGNGVLGGFVIRAMPRWSQVGTHPWRYWFLATSLGFVMAAILSNLRVLTPKLKAGEPRSLLYFDHVGKRYRDPTNFNHAFRELLNDEPRLIDQIADQVWANSRVARKKFVAAGWATRFTALALALAGLGGIMRGA